MTSFGWWCRPKERPDGLRRPARAFTVARSCRSGAWRRRRAATTVLLQQLLGIVGDDLFGLEHHFVRWHRALLQDLGGVVDRLGAAGGVDVGDVDTPVE